MGTFPGQFVRLGGKSLGVKRASRKRKHGYRLTYPHALRLQPLLPLTNFRAIVFFSQNQVGLHPGNATSRINQQFGNAVCIETAIFLRRSSRPSCVMDSTPHSMEMQWARPSKSRVSSVQRSIRVWKPIFTGRSAIPSSRRLDVFTHAKNFVDEIDVVNAARNQRVHFLQHSIHAAFAEFVAKKRLVAECAGPGASAGKLQFRAKAMVIGKYMMTVPVALQRCNC